MPLGWTRLVLLSGGILLSACDASFTDLRSEPIAHFVQGRFTDLDPGDKTPRLRGRWEGRAGHFGQGSVEIIERSDHALELHMLSDFDVSVVPGPVVVLSTRANLGPHLSDAEIEIAPLLSDQGEQFYPLDWFAESQDYVWIFCKPYGIEVARAALTSIP